jgi:hypothetical protein
MTQTDDGLNSVDDVRMLLADLDELAQALSRVRELAQEMKERAGDDD